MIKKIKTFLKLEKNTTETIDVFKQIDDMYDSLDTENICIELGSDIVIFNETIRTCIDKFRKSIKNKYGFVLPAIKVIDNNYLQENEIKIRLENKPVVQLFLIPSEEKITNEFKDNLDKLFFNHIDKIFTCRIMERYVKLVQKKNSYLIWNLTNTYSIVELKNIFIELIKNKKSIKNVSYIMEQIGEISLANGLPYHKEPRKITNELLKIL